MVRACNGFGSIWSTGTCRSSSLGGCNSAGATGSAEGVLGPSRADSPLPSALRGFSDTLLIREYLLRQFDIRLCASRAHVIAQNRFSETGRLRKPDATRNDGPKDLAPKKLAQIGGNLPRQDRTVVEHREQDAFNAQGVAERITNTFN